ncbi:MAG: hypothetical protein AABY01_00190 [Nanoarchaeota archaeon]
MAIKSFLKKTAAALTLTATSLLPQYSRADEPKDPATMTQAEWDAYTKEQNEKAAAEEARLDAEAKKTEADKTAAARTRTPITAKLDVQTYQIMPDAGKCPVPGDTHNAGFVRAFIAKEFEDSGFDGTLDAKIPVGKDLSLFGRFDYASQKGFEGDAKSTRKEYSALFGLSGPTTIRANLVKQLGTLSHRTSEHTVLVESPLIEQDVTVTDKTKITSTVYSALFKQRINDEFSFEVGGFSKKTVETAKTNIRSDTYGFITDLLEFEIENKTSYIDQGGNFGIEAKLADGLLFGAKIGYIHSETDTSLESPYLSEQTNFIENQFRPILTGRYNLIAAEIGGNLNRVADDRLIIGLAGVIPAGKLMFLPRAGLNRIAGRGYANAAIMFNHENDYTDSQAQQFLTWDIANHQGADDPGLTRRQLRDLQFDRLAQLVNAVPGTYFSAGVDTPSKLYHEYTFRLATDAGKLVPGLSAAAELTVAREYKLARMRLSENLGGGFTIYLEGGFEKNGKADTNTKYAGVGAQLEFGGK